jgi:hypothetical protein
MVHVFFIPAMIPLPPIYDGSSWNQRQVWLLWYGRVVLLFSILVNLKTNEKDRSGRWVCDEGI